MSKFKAGDKVRIVKCSGEDAWYKNNIGELGWTYCIDTETDAENLIKALQKAIELGWWK
jgi:hypothetical protein